MRATALVAAGLLAAAVPALAACPNQCSGHGRCGANDVCACYANWQAPDCSERTCPFTKAWSDEKDTSVDGRAPHYYAECGNRGVCDRDTGVCECDDGFEGEGCERMSCPGGNLCNGHGRCELMESINANYDGWDGPKIQHCSCDPGYEGHTCELRKCKLGDDPLTTRDSSGTLEADNEQEITIDSTTFGANDQFLLGYTDWRGATWVSKPIPCGSSEDLTAIAVEEALMTMPMRAVDSVSVTVGVSSTTQKVFTVTFTSSETPGLQPDLQVYYQGCTSHGCQPVYSGLTGVTANDVAVVSTGGTSERAVCSNRGKCDSETGICKCLKGYYGHACEFQTLVL